MSPRHKHSSILDNIVILVLLSILAGAIGGGLVGVVSKPKPTSQTSSGTGS